MIAEVKEGMTYTGTVVELNEAQDSFVKKNGAGGKSWCHYMKILVSTFPECDPINAQVCSDQQTFNLFEPNDDIKFQITRFAQNRNTIKFIQIVKTSAEKEWRKEKWEELEKEPDVISKTPMIVSGTIPDRALYIAAIRFQYVQTTDEQFFGFVKKVEDHLQKSLQSV